MEQVIVRTAGPEDLEVLLEFEQEIIKAERPFDITLREDPIRYYDLEKLILADDAEVVVAQGDTGLIGSGYAKIKPARLYLDHKEYAYLGFMYTLPEYRGQGINKKIIARLKKWAKGKGLSEIRLTVYSDNLPAIKAYEKVGFAKHLIEMRIS